MPAALSIGGELAPLGKYTYASRRGGAMLPSLTESFTACSMPWR